MNLKELLGKALARKSAQTIDAEFKDAYRNILFGQYRGLAMDPGEVRKDADGILNSTKVEWEDLYRLELDIIKLEPGVSLRRRAWILRNEYQEIASPDEVKDYYASKPPDPEDADEMLLRVDCCRLQEELNWRYIVLTVLEEFRGSLTYRIVRWVLWLFVFLLVSPLLRDFFAVAFPTFSSPINLPFLVLILLPGILGGLVSTLRRIQATQFGGNADLVLTQLEEGSGSIVVSPFFGGIFAFLFFCLVAGNFLTGNLFPKIGFENLLPETVSSPDFAEYAKLIIWCFIAGFSERFVPDQLDILAKGVSNQSTSGSSKGTPPSPPPPKKNPTEGPPNVIPPATTDTQNSTTTTPKEKK